MSVFPRRHINAHCTSSTSSNLAFEMALDSKSERQTASRSPYQTEETYEHTDCSPIFFTPELLAPIVALLDTKTLLLTQRVNCLFRDIIRSSNACQHALFLLPEKHQEPFDKSRIQFNPLLSSKFAPWVNDSKITAESFASIELARCRDVYLRPEASWRTMLLTQPPVARFRAY